MTATKNSIIKASDILTATEIANNYLGKNATAAAATKGTQDSSGQQINTTYIKGLSASGSTITYTKGDGTTGTVTVSGGSGITLSSNVTVTKSTETAKYVQTRSGKGSIEISGYSSTTTTGSGSLTTTGYQFNYVTGIAAGTYTLQNLLQQLVNKSHTHTIQSRATKYDTNCYYD